MVKFLYNLRISKDMSDFEVISNSKWLLLKEIAQKEQSATELAKKLDTSVSNITQQLKLLEAYNIVTKEKSQEKHVGKPRIIYSLKEEFAYAAMIRNGAAQKRIFKLEGFGGFFFNLAFVAGTEDAFYILKFAFKHDELLKKCKAMGFIRSTKESIELFLLTENVDEVRSRFSNLFIEDIHGKTKKIINWTHNSWEIDDGLKRKDKYFLDMLRNVQILYDQSGALQDAKKRRE